MLLRQWQIDEFLAALCLHTSKLSRTVPSFWFLHSYSRTTWNENELQALCEAFIDWLDCSRTFCDFCYRIITVQKNDCVKCILQFSWQKQTCNVTPSCADAASCLALRHFIITQPSLPKRVKRKKVLVKSKDIFYRRLSCVSSPWTPRGHSGARQAYFVRFQLNLSLP